MLHFPAEIHRTTGKCEVTRQVLRVFDPEKVAGIQFLRNGRVRVTCKTSSRDPPSSLVKSRCLLPPLTSSLVRCLFVTCRLRCLIVMSSLRSSPLVLSTPFISVSSASSCLANGTHRGIYQVGFDIVRVMFQDPDSCKLAGNNFHINLFGSNSTVQGGGPPPTMVHLIFPLNVVMNQFRKFSPGMGTLSLCGAKNTSGVRTLRLALAWCL